MSRYLIRWYPVKPWDNLKIVNLDALDKNEEAQLAYSEYLDAVDRRGLDKYGKVGFNNSWLSVIEADNAVLASDIFKQKIEEEIDEYER